MRISDKVFLIIGLGRTKNKLLVLNGSTWRYCHIIRSYQVYSKMTKITVTGWPNLLNVLVWKICQLCLLFFKLYPITIVSTFDTLKTVMQLLGNGTGMSLAFGLRKCSCRKKSMKSNSLDRKHGNLSIKRISISLSYQSKGTTCYILLHILLLYSF